MRYSGLPDSVVRTMESLAYWSIDTAALTVLRPLVAPEYADPAKSGKYFVPIARELESSNQAKDASLGARLWAFSEELIKERLAVLR